MFTAFPLASGNKFVENLEGESEGNIPLGRPRRISEDNIKIELTETEWKFSDWIRLVQDRKEGILLSW
jgi:hypothetical protein